MKFKFCADYAELFFIIAVWSPDYEYEVSGHFVNVYLCHWGHFETHFLKSFMFFASREQSVPVTSFLVSLKSALLCFALFKKKFLKLVGSH